MRSSLLWSVERDLPEERRGCGALRFESLRISPAVLSRFMVAILFPPFGGRRQNALYLVTSAPSAIKLLLSLKVWLCITPYKTSRQDITTFLPKTRKISVAL